MSDYNNQIYRPSNMHYNKDSRFRSQKNELNDYNLNKIQSISFREEVKLPKGQDTNDWIAKNLSELLTEVSTLFSLMSEFCTEKSCPKMTAGNGYKYLWSEEIQNDDGKTKIQTFDISASEYINKLITWIKNCIDDQELFPVSPDASYPENFLSNVQQIMKRLFRFYAHVYYHHIHHFEQLKVDAVLNTSFRHYIYFAIEFHLVTPEQIEPLRNFIEVIVNND